MFRLKSRLSLSQPAPTRLVLRTNPASRVVFGVIGAFLVVAFFVSYDFQAGFEQGMIAGTVFYTVLTLTCVFVAGRGTSVAFDSEAGEVAFVSSLFGFVTGREAQPTTDIRRVVVQGIRFLKESEQPRPGLVNNRFRGYIARRNVYYKLFLEFEESRRLLEDSTDLSDLEAAGSRIAAFLTVDYHHEEL